MRLAPLLALATISLAPPLAGCTGTTGGELVTFDAFAAGPADAKPGEPYRFTSGRGWDVSLTRARLRVAGVYLNQAEVISVSGDTSCTLSGLYAAEVTTGMEVDVLSGELQRFPARGEATSDRARTGEVWLGAGRVDEPSDSTVVLDVAGTASKDGMTRAFEGQLTIGPNRVVASDDPAQPGRNPLCKQRIVSPIPVDLVPSPGGSLVLRVDPRGFFGNVDFGALASAGDSPPLWRFADAPDDQPSINLYAGVRASIGVYSFEWR